LADLFGGMAGRHGARGRTGPIPGADYEAGVRLTFEQAYAGSEIELDLMAVEYDEQGMARRVPHRMKVRIPSGVTEGQKLRLAGRGFKRADGTAGHLYANVQIVVPTVVDDRQRELFRELAGASSFNPRAQFEQEIR